MTEADGAEPVTAAPVSTEPPASLAQETRTTDDRLTQTRAAGPRRLVALRGHVGPAYHLMSVVAVALFAGLLVVALSTWKTGGLAAAVIICQVALAGCWTFGTATYGFPGTAVVAVVAAVVTDVVLIHTDRLRLGAVGVVFAVALLASFVHQILRRPPRRDLTVSLAQTVLAVITVQSLGILILVARLEADRVVISATLLCTAAALLVSHLVDLVVPVPRISPDVRRGAVGVVLGIGAGAAVAALRLDSTALSDVLGHIIFGVVVSAVAVLVSVAITFVVADREPDALGAAVVQAVAPFAAAAPIALYVALLVA